MSIFIKIGCLFGWFFCIFGLNAQKLQLNPDTAYTAPGGIAKINIELSPPADIEPQQVDISAWKALLPQGDTVWNDDWQRLGTKWVLPLRLMFLDTVYEKKGFLDLPPLDVPVKLGGRSTVLRTPTGATVIIGKFPLTNEELAPIKDIIAEPQNWRDYFTTPVIITLLVLTLLGLWIWYFFYKKRNAKQEIKSHETRLPPSLLALKRLEALKAKNLPEQAAWKEYYSELTFILRDYLKSDKKIKALESTSDEILKQLKKHNSVEELVEMRLLLHRADLVKFAKGLPPEDYHEEAMQVVFRFLKKE